MNNLDKNLLILMSKLDATDKTRITRWIKFAEGHRRDIQMYPFIDEGLPFYSRSFILGAYEKYEADGRSSPKDSGITYRKFRRLLREDEKCNGKTSSAKTASNTS